MRCSSHPHTLVLRDPNVHSNWKCDMITGVGRCLSGMTGFNQAGLCFPKIKGWKSKTSNYDLCSLCLRADIFINQITERED